jgi:CrcB protein
MVVMSNNAWILVSISVGAILGALGRYYTTLFWLKKKGNAFPYGTLFVNLAGSFLIGLMSIVVTSYAIPDTIQTLVITGGLGSLTTFSSYVLEASTLLSQGSVRIGVLYGVGSPVLGILSAVFGIWLGQHLIVG